MLRGVVHYTETFPCTPQPMCFVDGTIVLAKSKTYRVAYIYRCELYHSTGPNSKTEVQRPASVIKVSVVGTV